MFSAQVYLLCFCALMARDKIFLHGNTISGDLILYDLHWLHFCTAFVACPCIRANIVINALLIYIYNKYMQ